MLAFQNNGKTFVAMLACDCSRECCLKFRATLCLILHYRCTFMFSTFTSPAWHVYNNSVKVRIVEERGARASGECEECMCNLQMASFVRWASDLVLDSIQAGISVRGCSWQSPNLSAWVRPGVNFLHALVGVCASCIYKWIGEYCCFLRQSGSICDEVGLSVNGHSLCRIIAEIISRFHWNLLSWSVLPVGSTD